jgi:hypothetical protein
MRLWNKAGRLFRMVYRIKSGALLVCDTSLTRAEEKGQEIRLRTLRDLDAAAIRLKDVVKVVIDPFCTDRQVRATIFGQNSPDELEKAVAIIEALTRPTGRKVLRQLAAR